MIRDEVTYLLHFDEPIGNTDSKTGYAQHYTGSTPDLPARLVKHRTNSDVKIMAAVRQAGIGWMLARTWPGGRGRERQLKKQGGARRHCPVCKGQPPAAEVVYRAASRRPAPRERGAKPEPAREPLWESVAAHLDPGSAAAFLRVLKAAERAAWAAAKPGAPDYDARFAMACDMSRLHGDEASAIGRLAAARAVAEAEGWQPEPSGPDLDREAG